MLLTGCGSMNKDTATDTAMMQNESKSAYEEIREDATEAINKDTAEQESDAPVSNIDNEAVKSESNAGQEVPEDVDNSKEFDAPVSDTEKGTESEPELLRFVDVFGQEYEVALDPAVRRHDYLDEGFVHDGDKLLYQGDERYTYRLGIDVSHHQGDIDWIKVREAGYEFAFLRIGYRGYGNEGKLCPDTKFRQNAEQALAAGIDIGVYFFAQAVNEEEAKEEAEYVLSLLDGMELQLPVVYDPESILDAPARTDDVSGEQFTKNTRVFADTIREHGYEPMIYSNMLWEAYEFDLQQLSDLDIWYADYEPLPQTPYHFTYWQYTNEGHVSGVRGSVDLDIQLMLRE